MSSELSPAARTQLEPFRYGGCYAMAYALAEATGWEIECYVASMPHYTQVVHAWVVDSDKGALDALGYTTVDAIRQEYLDDDERIKKPGVSVALRRYATPEAFLEALEQYFGNSEYIAEFKNHFRDQVVQAHALILEHVLPPEVQAPRRKLTA